MHRTAILVISLLTMFHTSAWAMTPQGKQRASTPNGVSPRPQVLATIARTLGSRSSAGSGSGPGVMKQGPLKVYHMDKQTGTPMFIDRSALSSLMVPVGKVAAGTSPEEVAYRLIESNTETFRIDNPRDELVLADEQVDNNGRVHLVLDQVYRDVPLWNQQLVIHLNTDGTPYAANGAYQPTPRGIDVDADGVNADNAVDAAREYLAERRGVMADGSSALIPGYEGPKTDRCIYFLDGDTTPRLAWHVDIAPAVSEWWHCFVDVADGTVIDAYSASPRDGAATVDAVDYFGDTRTISVYEKNGEYIMYDETANVKLYDGEEWSWGDNDASIIKSPDNNWEDAIAVTVSANARTTYEFYLNEFGRDGVDDSCMQIPCLLHLTEGGQPLYNAYWGYALMGFGDPLAMSLDIFAHEWTHGVVQFTVDLEYHDEPGAINEAYADLMACMVDDDDWMSGEDCEIGTIRNLADPESFNMPAHMDDYREMEWDHGGVHTNMSIPCLAGYYIAEELGREKMGQIFYRVLANRYMSPQSEFINLRLGAIQAAKDLYGEESAEVDVVKDSFDRVGIVSDLEQDFPPEDRPPLTGDEYIAFVYDPYHDGRLAVARADADPSDELVYLSDSYVYTASSQPVSVSGDGSYLVYVDDQNNMQRLDLETFEESPVDESGVWNSVALSPNGRYLAATLTVPDSSIYVFDMEEPENSTAILMYSQTDAGPLYSALYADALDWDHTSTQILYDCYNYIPVDGDDPIEFWDVNILDVEERSIRRVGFPDYYNCDVANPSFAETNDMYVVCDVIYNEFQFTRFAIFDLFYNSHYWFLWTDYVDFYGDGQLYANLGHPRFSPDDSAILYERYDLETGRVGLYKQAINDMRNNTVGEPLLYRTGANNGVWYVRPDDVIVDVEDNQLPSAIELSQNFPNPFNPTTVIPFTVHQTGHVTLSVYDILGQEVTCLVDAPMMPGSYRVTFDAGSLGTGTYISRLEAGGKVAVSKMQLVK